MFVSWRCSCVIGSLSLPALKCLSSAAGRPAAETLCLRRDSGTDVTVVAAQPQSPQRCSSFVAAVLICCTFIIIFIIIDALDSGSYSKKCFDYVFWFVCFLSPSALGHCCVIVLCFITLRGHVAHCRLSEEGMEMTDFVFFFHQSLNVCLAAAAAPALCCSLGLHSLLNPFCNSLIWYMGPQKT